MTHDAAAAAARLSDPAAAPALYVGPIFGVIGLPVLSAGPASGRAVIMILTLPGAGLSSSVPSFRHRDGGHHHPMIMIM